MDCNYAIGIDGGATKTRAALVDKTNHRIVHEVTRKESANYHAKGMPSIARMINALIDELLSQASVSPEQIAFACLGATGLSTEDEYQKMSSELSASGNSFPYIATNDAITALLGGTHDNYGVLVIAGTGSIMMGINQEGNIARVGGWGALLGDEGSGYVIAVEGLRLACKQADGRLERTALTDEIFNIIQAKDIFDVRAWAIKVGFEKDKIAAVAPAIFKAYRKNDSCAENILLNQAKELAWGVFTTMKELEMHTIPVEVVAAGGNLIHNKDYFTMLEEEIKRLNAQAQLITPYQCPCIGAIKFGTHFSHQT